jgi:hypothetical protein
MFFLINRSESYCEPKLQAIPYVAEKTSLIKQGIDEFYVGFKVFTAVVMNDEFYVCSFVRSLFLSASGNLEALVVPSFKSKLSEPYHKGHRTY